MPQDSKTALVVCYSNLVNDPRVTRQIDWLTGAGWTVDTLGLGPVPRPAVRRHYAMIDFAGPRSHRVVRLLIHALLPNPLRFRALEGSRIPSQVIPEKGSGYDLVLVNDIDLLPWVDRHAHELLAPGGRCHLDVHEYHKWEPSAGANPVVSGLFARYHRWLVSFIGSPVFTSRSTVAAGIARLYEDDFAIPPMSLVRNSPAYLDQRPSPVDPERIRLIYHGNADLARGLHLLIEAVPLLEPRFTLTLMLTGTTEGRAALSALTAQLGTRVSFIDAVPMAEVAATVNSFDLEVIFYPPTGPNYLYSFPNKFFEAVQGRLGIIVGQSPSMVEIVEAFGNGAIVEGWSAGDLARTLNSLSAGQIERMKAASDECAAALNSEREGELFLAGLRGSAGS